MKEKLNKHLTQALLLLEKEEVNLKKKKNYSKEIERLRILSELIKEQVPK